MLDMTLLMTINVNTAHPPCWRTTYHCLELVASVLYDSGCIYCSRFVIYVSRYCRSEPNVALYLTGLSPVTPTHPPSHQMLFLTLEVDPGPIIFFYYM
ncbi:hypothetical protein GDO81_024563 [Engystomops pustulosus]|uniref:Uncharacterized protein n=1 Tax=Engystomops pustulosus TaxID=76066 RepID=A0AAV6YTR6_ENGPU|nr:hypothetical protein GDO81_024563 [Engystomops pustulosus]